ncbi:hypothetical protein N8Z78_03180, partial [Octadecabacter sp.]|nr:hypothetical protein [Octadecabacter sp.]
VLALRMSRDLWLMPANLRKHVGRRRQLLGYDVLKAHFFKIMLGARHEALEMGRLGRPIERGVRHTFGTTA